jgi:hypothetical protein
VINYLKKHMVVKYDKPHSCYNFFQLLDHLNEMPAEELAIAIKGSPD